jgi:hypothetical protein
MNNQEKQQQYLQKRRAAAKEYLGGECKVCGLRESLEFDHISPSTKSFDISSAIAKHMSWSKLVLELDKCQLLCSTHHLEKTKLDRRSAVTHGKYHTAYHLKCSCVECIEFKSSYRPNRKRPTPARVQSRELVHGTRAGYLKELRMKLPTCEACKKANTEYTRLRQ